MSEPTRWSERREPWDPAKYRLDFASVDAPFAVILDETGEGLFWTRRVAGHGSIAQPESPREKLSLLPEFMALADAPDEQIRAFAARWGTLEICEHGLPASHNPMSRVWYRTNPILPCVPRSLLDSPYRYSITPDSYDEAKRFYWEPIERWRHFANQARLICRISGRLHAGKLGAPEDWAALEGRPVEEYLERKAASEARLQDEAKRESLILERDEAELLAEQKRHIAEKVQEWLEWGGIQPQFVWAGESPHILLDPLGLFGQLAQHLALAVAKIDGFATCSECGNPYIPERKPRADQRNYCATCKAGGADRRYKMNRLNARKRAEAGAPARPLRKRPE